MTYFLLIGCGAGAAGLGLGYLIAASTLRRRLSEAGERYEALQRDFAVISAVNVRLMARVIPTLAVSNESLADDRFFDLYDDAKRCLHRTLDQHNATATRPLVISRDGSNLLQVLADLPEHSFSQEAGEDAGVRSWLRRVFELDIERRAKRDAWRPDAVVALETERDLWLEPLKKRA